MTELVLICIVQQRKEWYSRDIQKLWCFSECMVEVADVFVPLADTALM